MTILASFRNLYQLGYVARDLERAMAAVEREFGQLDFIVTEPSVPIRADGVATQMSMRVALASADDRQIEIIEPVSGATGIYTDGVAFDAADLIFHHVGIAVIGPHANWQRLESDLAAKGHSFKVLFPPEPGPDPVARYGYVDTRGLLGHYTEYLWWSDALAASPTFPDRSRFTA